MVTVTDADAHTALWNQVTPELRSGEELLWVGKPMPIRVMLANGEMIGSIAGAVLIIGVLVFFNSFRTPPMALNSSFGLFQLLFVGVGLFILSRPIYEFLMAGRTVYGLTDQRAILIKPTLNGKKVESYTDSDTIERHDIANGKGDLVFRQERSFYRQSGRTRTRIRKIGFFGIDNVQEVEALMLRVFAVGKGNLSIEAG